jgi:hypothetical protein
MVRYLRMTMLGVTLVAMVAGNALAQLPQSTLGPSTDRPATEATPPAIGIIEGTIEKVDASARTVSGLFGAVRVLPHDAGDRSRHANQCLRPRR